MISPSKRRRSQVDAGAEFTLHVTAGRRLAARKRLWRASVSALTVALVGAVVGLFLPLPLVAHLTGLLVGAAVGALLPARPQTGRALSHIAEATGLAYETALEVQARRAGPAPGSAASSVKAGARDSADEFGLEAQLLRRAVRSVRDYRPESTPPWWLPVATLALTVVALSRIVPGLSESTRPPPSTATIAADPAASEPFELGDDLTPALPAAGRAEAPSTARAPAGGTETRDALPAGDSGAGNEALSRFLEALRQSPADGRSSGEQPDSGGAPASAEGSFAGDIQPTPGRGEPAPEAAEAPPATDADRQPSEQASGSGEAGHEGDRAEQGAGSRQGAETVQGAEAGQDANGTGAADPRQGGGPGAERSEAEGVDQEARLEEGGQAVAGGSGERPGEEVAGGEGDLEPGGAGDDLAGAVGTGGAEVPDTGTAPEDALAAGGVELLPGVVQGGPFTPAGNVRLPGDDQVQLPQGVELGPYATTVEEALGEGDLPAEYQEIIRRYFR